FRSLEGFINSIFQLMDVPLTSPGYSCLCKRVQAWQESMPHLA
ncbi:hypothetical protein DK870_29460, partial [Pseudomonas sp. Q1]|nr:hypothetical protein [Pseudomonas sp. Q1]